MMSLFANQKECLCYSATIWRSNELILMKNMNNSNDQMERSRLRLKRLRKLTELIKIEEAEFINQFGDDEVEFTEVLNDKRGRYDKDWHDDDTLLQEGLVKFPVYKYYIQSENNAGCIDYRSITPYSFLSKQFAELITKIFKEEDYVFIASNASEAHQSSYKYFFKLFAKAKYGKFIYTLRKEECLKKYELLELKKLENGMIEYSTKLSYLRRLVYTGSPIEGENLIIMGDEFGFDDDMSNLLITLRPKAVLNILISNKYHWLDNVD